MSLAHLLFYEFPAKGTKAPERFISKADLPEVLDQIS